MTDLPNPLPISTTTADGIAQAIIDRALIRTATSVRPNVYVIGNYAGRINFYAQQSRALNLVWALIHKGEIGEGDRIGVVGGGLAGVTAAIALLQKGAEPELFEQYRLLFRYQRNTVTRHVHPTVNYWPNIPIAPSTDFPFLNWHEDNPSEIIASIEAEISKNFGDFAPQTSCQVIDLKSEAGGVLLTVKHSPTDPGEQIGPYKVVIIACGFGVENRPADLPTGVPYSYWHNDDVLPPAVPDWSPEHVFISGAGDGGLIDVIRASLHRFDNGREIIALAKLLDTPGVRKALDNLMKSEQPDGEAYWNNHDSFNNYANVSLPNNFNKRLKNNLSGGFPITLNSKYEGIFAPTSSVIHRVIVAQLVKLSRLDTQVGYLLEVEWSQPARLRVGRKNPDGSKAVTWEGEAARVIARHGARGAWIG
jgi:hypothetical protein